MDFHVLRSLGIGIYARRITDHTVVDCGIEKCHIGNWTAESGRENLEWDSYVPGKTLVVKTFLSRIRHLGLWIFVRIIVNLAAPAPA